MSGKSVNEHRTKIINERLVPDHNTISNFKRDTPKAIIKVFRSTVNVAKDLDLIDGILLVGDVRN